MKATVDIPLKALADALDTLERGLASAAHCLPPGDTPMSAFDYAYVQAVLKLGRQVLRQGADAPPHPH